MAYLETGVKNTSCASQTKVIIDKHSEMIPTEELQLETNY